MKEETIIAHSTNSICGNCDFDCDPSEKSRETILGYNQKLRKLRGCGITWKYITTAYISVDDIKERMDRQDLIEVNYYDFTPTLTN